jgi:uncharacterized integral membrane protein
MRGSEPADSDPVTAEDGGEREPPATSSHLDGAGTAGPVKEYRGAGIMWGAIALVLVAAAFVIVAVQNAHDVEFEFLWMSVSTPLILIIAITIAVTLVIDEAVGLLWRRQRRNRLREREELRRLRSERRRGEDR